VSEQERAMRFGYLVSEVEVGARSILDGRADDVPATLLRMTTDLAESYVIAMQVSREALDKVVPK